MPRTKETEGAEEEVRTEVAVPEFRSVFEETAFQLVNTGANKEIGSTTRLFSAGHFDTGELRRHKRGSNDYG